LLEPTNAFTSDSFDLSLGSHRIVHSQSGGR
jgi:hypothetical protein